jgi:hypothetical protein
MVIRSVRTLNRNRERAGFRGEVMGPILPRCSGSRDFVKSLTMPRERQHYWLPSDFRPSFEPIKSIFFGGFLAWLAAESCPEFHRFVNNIDNFTDNGARAESVDQKRLGSRL